jgi:hypothetical protein
MSSALSITQAVNPPRAVFLDYPLGHTAGKANDKADQRRVMIETLRAFERIQDPGKVVTLKNEWSSDHSWKDRVMRASPRSENDADRVESLHEDDRVERYDTPQYQTSEDARRADPACPTCIFLEEP